MSNLKGIFAVTITPFKDNGEFDYDGSKKNVDWLIENGVHGLCLLGATGEYLSVTTEEHKEYLEIMMKHIAGRVPVIVGTTRERTDDVIELVEHAKANGVAAGMVLPPYYCKPLQEEIYMHYKNINDAVDFPILVYNNPHSAGVDIEYDTLVQIAELPNMKLIKESSGDIKRLTAVAMNLSDKIVPFCGWENMSYESFVMGAKGWICVLANIAPGMCVDLYESVVEEKDYAKGYEVYKKALPVLNFLEGFPKFIQLVKYVLNKKGLDGGFIRKPKVELTAEEKKMIDEAINIEDLY